MCGIRTDIRAFLLTLSLRTAGFDMDKIHLKVSLHRDARSGTADLFLCVQRNAPVAALYEDAIKKEGAVISSSGALINFSGKKTGRSPKDKRVVYEDSSKDDVWVCGSCREASPSSTHALLLLVARSGAP